MEPIESPSFRARVSAFGLATLLTLGWYVILVVFPGRYVVFALAVYAAASTIVVYLSNRSALRALFAPSRRGVISGIVSGAFLTAVTYLICPILEDAVSGVGEQLAGLYRLFDGLNSYSISLLVFSVVIGEEIIWRGPLIIDRGLQSGQHWCDVKILFKRRQLLALACSVALYTIVQLAFGTWLMVVLAFCCGILWCSLRIITGNLCASLISHLIWDFFVIILWPPVTY